MHKEKEVTLNVSSTSLAPSPTSLLQHMYILYAYKSRKCNSTMFQYYTGGGSC